MVFNDLNLHPDLKRGIADAGYVDCMPVQEQVLSMAFGGQDLYVQSQTGTGKTAAFLIVIFQRLLTDVQLTGRKALIMAPTRELAVQIEEEAIMLAKHLPIKTGCFYGGVGYTQQEKLLKDNVQILVGTPGRVLDLNKSGKMNLMNIAFLVIDEADRMFDMGFYPDLRKLIKVVPPANHRQTMLFSATLNAWVKNLAWEYTKSPVEIEIKPEIITVDEVDQILYHLPSEEKMQLLLGILNREKPESAIIFCNTKRYTEIIAKRLRANGYACEFIIGDMPQSRRLSVINDVKLGKTKILVATDVAARGLDIEDLAMVINYDLPLEAENYVHRIGRTARAGKTGRAITLASEQDVYELPAIERYIGKKIPSEIAMRELFAEDKSAGQKQFLEFPGDPREERRRSGAVRAGNARSGSVRSGGARAGGSRAGSARSSGARSTSFSGKDSRGSAGRGSRSAGSSGSAGGNSDRDYNRSRSRGNTERGMPVNRKKSGASADLSVMSFDERMAVYKKKYNTGTETLSKDKKPVPEKSAAKQEKPAGKQGLLSRILGLFGKKKQQ